MYSVLASALHPCPGLAIRAQGADLKNSNSHGWQSRGTDEEQKPEPSTSPEDVGSELCRDQ